MSKQVVAAKAAVALISFMMVFTGTAPLLCRPGLSTEYHRSLVRRRPSSLETIPGRRGDRSARPAPHQRIDAVRAGTERDDVEHSAHHGEVSEEECGFSPRRRFGRRPIGVENEPSYKRTTPVLPSACKNLPSASARAKFDENGAPNEK